MHLSLFSFADRKKVLKAIRRFFIIPILPRFKEGRETLKEENKRYLKLVFDIHKEERRMDHLDDYNKLSVIPDLTCKYIYFPLQQEPEDTTMPRAGEFKNQILSLLILSEAAQKRGIKIYVKEHWVQEHREKGYYKRLRSIENLQLVDIASDSCELIKNSVAVASQTGSSIFEAMILGKNSLIFGAGCPYKDSPGSFFVSNVEDVSNALDSIITKGNGFTENDINRYIFAYQESCIEFYCDSLDETHETYNRANSARRVVECISGVAKYIGNSN